MTRPLTLEEIDLLYKEMRSAPNPVCYVTVGEIVHLIETVRMLYAVKEAASDHCGECVSGCPVKEALRPFQNY